MALVEVMRARWQLLAAAVALSGFGLTTGCVEAPAVVVVNGSGAELVLTVRNLAAAPRQKNPREVRIAPGKWKHLRPADDFENVRLTSHGCEVRYEVPEVFSSAHLTPEQQVDPQAPWAHYPVVVEVGPDFTIYVGGLKKGHVVPVEELASRQGYGFPVKPTSKTCR